MYQSHKVLQASVILNNTFIEGNLNIVEYSDISNAANVDDKRSKAISSFVAGMTVLFSEGNYTVNVLMSHGHWNFNSGGLFNDIAFIFSDAPVGSTSITVTNSEFNHNILGSGFDKFKLGCMITTSSFDKKILNAQWNIISISDSLIHDA